MPRFYFDFCQNGERIEDHEGMELASMEQAYLEAFSGARDMWTELLRERRDPRRCRFEVRGLDQDLLFVLPFQEVLDACHNNQTPPLKRSFEEVRAAAHQARTARAGFREELELLRDTLSASRALLRVE